jgi:6-pyruvoyltetrahydropterin/6-carboxytetrahydropterin synthase
VVEKLHSRLTRTYVLPALHTLTGSGFSAQENLQVFGPCSRLHGHDYRIEVSVTGPVDQKSGMMIQRDEMDRIVESNLIEPLKGRNLSDHFSHTTGEALAIEFYALLESHFPAPARLERLTVHETPKNSFTIHGAG